MTRAEPRILAGVVVVTDILGETEQPWLQQEFVSRSRQVHQRSCYPGRTVRQSLLSDPSVLREQFDRACTCWEKVYVVIVSGGSYRVKWSPHDTEPEQKDKRSW